MTQWRRKVENAQVRDNIVLSAGITLFLGAATASILYRSNFVSHEMRAHSIGFTNHTEYDNFFSNQSAAEIPTDLEKLGISIAIGVFALSISAKPAMNISGLNELNREWRQIDIPPSAENI